MSEFKFSENKIFGVDPKDEEFLYIHQDYFNQVEQMNPFILKFLIPIRQSSREAKLPNYIKVGNIIKFKNLDNDCLLLAEGIISYDLSKPDYKTAKLRVLEDKSRLFGHSDKQNIQIAQDINKKMTGNEYYLLDPEIMQAYAMLPVFYQKIVKHVLIMLQLSFLKMVILILH